MEEKHTIIIVPLGVVIAIIFGGMLVTVGGLNGLKMWFEENLYSFIRTVVIVSIISAVVCSILTKNIVYGLSCLVSASQAIFFIAYGGYNLPTSHGMHFEALGSSIWSLFVFVLYIIYSFVITLATIGFTYLVAIGIARKKSKDKNALANEDGKFYSYGGANIVVGVIGWIINGIFLGLIPLIF